MINQNDIKNLSALARIEISEEEVTSLTKDLENILGYVSELSEVELSAGDLSSETATVRNVMRDDGGAHESGLYTKEILAEAPNQDGKFIKVKKILG